MFDRICPAACFIGRFRRQLFTLLALMIVPAIAHGATFYVNKSGNDSNSCTTAQSSSPANAKLSIRAGIACLTPGSTLIIGDGTYNEFIHDTIPSGTSGNPTTIRAANRNKAILMPNAPSDFYVVVIDGETTPRSWITLDGLLLDATNIQSYPFFARGNVSNITFQHGTARNGHDRYSSGVVVGSHGFQASNNTVLDNDIYDNGREVNESCGEGQLCGVGVYLASSNSLVDGNRVHGNQSYGIQVYRQMYAPNRNVVRNNVFYNQKLRGIYIGAGGTENLIYNNVIYRNGTAGNHAAAGIDLEGARNEVYNNTIYGNDGVCIHALSGSSGSHTIQNNICYGNMIDDILNDGSGTLTSSFNLYVNPSFLSPTTGDFRISASSAARNTGVRIASVTADIIGNSRPHEGSHDIGAYEYVTGDAGGGSGATNVLSPPANLRVVAQ